MLNNPPVFGQPYTFDIGLVDQADTKKFKVNPTLAAGDFKISIDGGALTNLASLPTVSPASGQQVRVALSAAEMTGQNCTVYWIDASGAEWCDGMFNVQPSAGFGIVEYGTAQAAGASTLTLRSAAAYADNELAGASVAILSGTGAGQMRQIASNVGSTDVVTVSPAWTTTPSGTIIYAVFNSPPAVPLTTGSLGSGALDDINGALINGFIAWLRAGVTRDTGNGNLTVTDKDGGSQTIAIGTNAAAVPVVSFT